MATFIKGDAIPNAWQYSLEKMIADGTYESIATQIATGEVLASLIGHYTDDGTPVAESDHLRTGALAVRILTDYEGENTCVKTLEPTDYYSAVFVYSENEPDIFTATVFKGGLHYDELMEAGTSAEKIRELAEGFGANYVIFVTSVPTVDTRVAVRLSTDINFCLDDYEDKLDIGTNYLVVRALAPLGPVDTDGDGKVDTQYTDSAYGGDKDGNPVVYTVEFPEGTVRNLFNKDSDENVDGKIITGGNWTTQYATGMTTSHFIPCVAGQKFSLNSKSIVNYYAADKTTWIVDENPSSSISRPRTMTVPNNSSIAYFRFAFLTELKDTMMCVEGETYPDTYIPYRG